MDVLELDRRYVAHTYNRFPLEIEIGKGSVVRGSDGMGTNEGDTILSAPDSVKSMKRKPTEPIKKTPVTP